MKKLKQFLKNRRRNQILRTMKIVTFFLLMCLIQATAGKVYSQDQEITLKEKEVSLKNLFQQIEKKSEYRFLYSTAGFLDLSKKVDVNVQGKKISEVLNAVLYNTDIEYKLVGNKLIVIAPMLQQKQIRITGKVVSKSGETLTGVTVLVKGTTKGGITDVNGNYSISVNTDDKVLVFSFIGMKKQEVMIANQRVINVVLESETSTLDEVVIVAFGSQKKVSVTGAVASIPMTLIKQEPVSSLANALAGRLPGLTSIQSGGGQPGRDDATMYLRGVATTNGSSPLILIDGVPRDNIRTIDLNEVESISILKDASATAVFGVRGANGVILITTKRGVEGKPEFTINVVQSYTSFTREPDRLHSLEYMKLRNEASANDNISPLPFSQALMDKYANPLAGLDPKDPNYAAKAKVLNYEYPDHDYYRELISRYAPQTNINANVSGGTDRVSYFVNAAYLHQGGNLNTEPESVLGYDPSSKMDRFSFRTNLDYKVSKSLKAFLNIGSYIEQVNMPSAGTYPNNDTNWMMSDLLYQAQTILPITPGPTTLAGFGIAPGQVVDPGYLDRSAFEIMNRQGFRNEMRSNLNSSFGLDWDLGNTITKGLSVKGMISYDSKSMTFMQGYKTERLYLAQIDPLTDQLSYAVKKSSESLLAITKSAYSRYNINMQGSINYNRTFGNKHTIGGMILGQRDSWETTDGEIPYNVLGISGRVTYGYDNRYLAEVDMGYNGSEQFAPGKRFGFFPAVSAGWVVSNEDFLKGNHIITNLKIRASYGKVGNDQMGGARFLYQSDITMGGGPLSSLGLGQSVNQGLLGNPNISWEVAKKQNYGIDLQLLKNLDASFDYFVENRSNILISRGTVPAFQGIPLDNIPKVNMGLVDNKGYEFVLTYNKSLTKNLSLRVSGNYSYNHNKVKFMDEQIRDSTYAMRYASTGLPIGQATGYKIDYSNGNGYFNSKEELATYLAKTTYSFGQPRVGDFKYVDVNHDGVIDSKDIVPIGYSSIPEISYGFSMNLQYKAIDFTAFFQGVSKYSTNYANQGVYENIKLGTYFDYHKNAWTAERYNNGEKITYPALSTVSNTNDVPNSFFIMDRSFIRLKSIEIAYTFPKSALRVVGVQKLRVYVSAENYFTWDKLRMNHLDPETSNSIGYPETKMLNFGLNITF
jgi:TonB-linked SusC/RagA family outer membrane protein